MFYAMLLLAALLAFIAIAFFIGLNLPEAHTASRAATFHAPPDTLFPLIAGPQDWRIRCEPAPASTQSKRQWREISRHGPILFEETQSTPPRLFQSRIADPGLPFGGSWTYELSPQPPGTRLRITEHGLVHSPLLRFLSRYLFGHTRTMDAYLHALARKCGESITIEN